MTEASDKFNETGQRVKKALEKGDLRETMRALRDKPPARPDVTPDDRPGGGDVNIHINR